mgnify:CR=1 FL=1
MPGGVPDAGELPQGEPLGEEGVVEGLGAEVLGGEGLWAWGQAVGEPPPEGVGEGEGEEGEGVEARVGGEDARVRGEEQGEGEGQAVEEEDEGGTNSASTTAGVWTITILPSRVRCSWSSEINV